MRKYSFLFCFFLIIYLLFMNLYGNFELGHDQARHANNGALWYYYFHGYGDKEFSSFDEFLQTFPEFSRNKIGWYFVWDPPLHGLLTAGAYTLVGMTEFAARLPTQLLHLFGITFLFLLAKEYTSERNALLIAMLYALTPFVFHLGRDAMTDAAAVAWIIAWMYCTFYWAEKGTGWKKYWRWTMGALFLAAGTMTKYPVFFFFVVFMAFYFLFLTIHGYCRERIWGAEQNRKIFLIGLLQCIVLLGSTWSWLSYSWFDKQMFSVLTGVGGEDWTLFSFWYNAPYLIYEFFIETAGIILFALLFIFQRKYIEKKHLPLLLYSFTALFIIPYFFTNIQPRYYMSLLPFLLILIVVALEKTFSEKITSRICIAYVVFFLVVDLTMAYAVLQNNGQIDATAFDETFATFSGAAVFFNYYGNFDTIDSVSGPHVLTMKSWWRWLQEQRASDESGKEMHHYYNPDLFMFRMFQKLRTYPETGFTYLSSAELEGTYGEDLLSIMNQTKTSFPTYFVLANTKQGEEYQQMQHFLSAVPTKKYNYTYWDFYVVK